MVHVLLLKRRWLVSERPNVYTLATEIELPAGVRPLSEDLEEEEAAVAEQAPAWDELALSSIR